MSLKRLDLRRTDIDCIYCVSVSSDVANLMRRLFQDSIYGISLPFVDQIDLEHLVWLRDKHGEYPKDIDAAGVWIYMADGDIIFVPAGEFGK